MAFQSLYRRFRPQRFIDVRGQDHVSHTLRNAVRDGRVAHAYLFSGPRGTGKTSSARILAKALNCANPDAGEPCGVCTSCVEIAEGRSLDVMELDAASNRGVDAIRDLVSRASLGTPGRWKVYIVDEVHMLTTEASNTLLKTLEEPPGHVIFVLATTEPQKVLPTIRSRTQHFEFRLLSVDVLADHLRWVADQAGLDIPDEVIRLVARRGAGSARDALSKLDQVAAAGGIDDVGPSTDEVVEALCERDIGRALIAVAERIGAGHDPRRLAGELLEHLRQAFLATVARALVALPDDEVARMESQAARMGRAAIVRAMEVLGDALVAMRDAPDTRVLLEVSLVRLCRPEADVSPAAMLDRIERLERALAGGGGGRAPSAPSPTPAPAAAATHAGSTRPAGPTSTPPPTPTPTPAGPPPALPPAESPAAAARLALGGVRPPSGPPRPASPRGTPPPTRVNPAAAAPAPPPPTAAPAAPPAASDFPSRDDLTVAWGDTILPTLPPKARARYKAGRFVDVPEPGVAGFALPTPIHRERCAEVQGDVEYALAAHFGRRVPLKLLVEAEVGVPVADEPDEEEHIDPRDLRDAPSPGVTSPIDHVMQAFEGATLVEEVAMPQMPQQPDMNALLKQAQKMQEQLLQARAAAEEAEIEGQAGGGMVKIKVNGAMEFLSVSIDPAAVDPEDVGMLEDLVLAAIRDAVSKTAEQSEKAMGGIDLGALGGLLEGDLPHRVYAVPVQVLIDELGRLPGVGPKSAQRIAFHLLKLSKDDANRLAQAITDAKDRVSFCQRCFNVTEGAECGICADGRRDTSILCVVEEPRDVVAVEKTSEFRGRYHVLQGAINPLEGIGPDQLRVRELLLRLEPEGVMEVILCTNPNIEGEATAMYLARLLKPLGVKTTRIASGLPVGGDLEYADELTLGRALEGRRTLDG